MQESNKDSLLNKESSFIPNINNFKNNDKLQGDKLMNRIKLGVDKEDEIANTLNFDSTHEKKVLNFNNKFLQNNKSPSKELKNTAFIPRNKMFSINEEEKKTFQRSDIKHKTISNCSGNRKQLEMKSIPQTSIERIVKTMNKIKSKLLCYSESDLVQEVEWVIKEILSDNMYRIKMHEKTSKEESDFYNVYSNNQSELLLSRDISNYGIQLMNNSPNLDKESKFEIDLVENLKAPKIEEFGPEFDVFDFAQKNGRENCLLGVSHPIFHYKNINKYIDFHKFPEFVNQIRLGYTSSPDALYHTDYHAADVLQTTFYFCNTCKFDEVLQLDGIDTLSLLFSALIHDYKHPGFTNTYMIQTSSEISTYYNDKSPLENHHLAQAFLLLQNQNYNIFSCIKIEFLKILRKRTIECVLSTDMAFHTKIFGQISSKLDYFLESKPEKTLVEFFTDQTNQCSKFDLQQEFMNYILHFADIAHPAKPWNIELKWSELIFKEFFNQGDKEKALKLPVSFLCDRTTTSVPKSQIGFLKNIIMPSFSLVLSIIPLSESLNKYLTKNLENWMLLEDEENRRGNSSNCVLNNYNNKAINTINTDKKLDNN